MIHKLFCLPFAGGSGSSYLKLQKHLDSSIELVPLDFPGRGKAADYQEAEQMQDIIDFIYHTILSRMDGNTYSIMGHSMGGYLSYEIACMISRSDYKMPDNVILSAAPLKKVFSDVDIENISRDNFNEIVLKNQWIPEKVVNNHFFREYFYKVLLSDLKLAAQFHWKKKKLLKHSNIYFFFGESDQYEISSYYAWEKYIEWDFEVLGFPGGHFFILENQEKIADALHSIIF